MASTTAAAAGQYAQNLAQGVGNAFRADVAPAITGAGNAITSTAAYVADAVHQRIVRFQWFAWIVIILAFLAFLFALLAFLNTNKIAHILEGKAHHNGAAAYNSSPYAGATGCRTTRSYLA